MLESLLGLVDTDPKSKVPSCLRSVCVISAIESMEVKTYDFSMAWMPAWRTFLVVRLGTCVES
jgi:hypothetical protein